MRRKLATLILTLTLTSMSYGQTMKDIFRSLPLEYTSELTQEKKDSIVELDSCSFSIEDDVDNIECSYLIKNDFLRLEFLYISDPGGIITVEFRKFQKTDGSIVIVYSKHGYSRGLAGQLALTAFDYKNKAFTPLEVPGFPVNVDPNEFFVEGLPDNINPKELELNAVFNLNPNEQNAIEYEMDPRDDLLNPWIDSNSLLFVWNGEGFQKQKHSLQN